MLKIHKKIYIWQNLLFIKLQALVLQLQLKETPVQVFSCEFCEILKNTFLRELLRRDASVFHGIVIIQPFFWKTEIA